jgi:trk system potassium uptake protein TrkA
MYILIIGGGEIGYYLTKTLLEAGHRVGVVEGDGDRCRSIAEKLGITVFNGDGTDINVLREAGAEEAHYVVAVTGRDEANMVICQLAKRHFKAPLTIALVKNPKNQAIFKSLGVDATVSSTTLAAQMIQNALPLNGMRIFSIFQQEDVEITEVELKDDSPIAGLAVAQLALPKECVLIAVVRDGRIDFPRGQTVLQAGDRVFALVRRQELEPLKQIILGGPR